MSISGLIALFLRSFSSIGVVVFTWCNFTVTHQTSKHPNIIYTLSFIILVGRRIGWPQETLYKNWYFSSHFLTETFIHGFQGPFLVYGYHTYGFLKSSRTFGFFDGLWQCLTKRLIMCNLLDPNCKPYTPYNELTIHI